MVANFFNIYLGVSSRASVAQYKIYRKKRGVGLVWSEHVQLDLWEWVFKNVFVLF